MRKVALLITLVIGGAAALHPSIRAASDVPRVTPTQSVPLGAEPLWVAVHPGLQRAYVTNSGDGTLSVVDLAAGAVVAEVAVGRSPLVVAVDPGLDRAYVSDFADRTVSVVDLRSNTVVATLSVGGHGLAVDPTSHRVYAAGGDHIAVIEGLTNEVVSRWAAPAGSNVWGLALDVAVGRLFATDLATPRLLVFEAASGQLGGEVPLPAAGRLALAVDPLTRQVLAATDVPEGAQLVVIDAERLVTLRLASVPALPFAIAAVAPGRVYVSGPQANEVPELSGATGLRTATLGTGRSALGLAVHAGRVLVVDRHDDILGLRGRLLVFEPRAAVGQP